MKLYIYLLIGTESSSIKKDQSVLYGLGTRSGLLSEKRLLSVFTIVASESLTTITCKSAYILIANLTNSLPNGHTRIVSKKLIQKYAERVVVERGKWSKIISRTSRFT
jgi:hypothetical protein